MAQDVYQPCSNYENKALHPTEVGFASFQDDSDSLFYFALLDADGRVLLRSEGYPQQIARENGISSVNRNRTNNEFYSVKNEDGKFYLCLRAANYREIARSCPFETEGEALALIPFATGEQIRGGEPSKPKKVADEYLVCSAYEGHPDAGIDGFKSLVKFKHEENFYFAWYIEDTKLLMRSEGYLSETARDKGMASVDNNRELEERYSIIEDSGKYYTVLKAGNYQEIARSCPFDSEAAAKSIFPSERAKVAAEKAAALAAAAAAAEAAAIAARKAREDNYLACSEYQSTDAADANGTIKFKHTDGEYYGAVLAQDGRVQWRTEGYSAPAARDKGLESILANKDNKDRYTIVEKAGKQFVILKSGNHQEIGRSCALDNIEAVWALFPILDPNPPKPKVDLAAPLAAAGVAAAGALAADIEAPKAQSREDNYLFCKEYENHGVADANDVTKWQHTEGEHFFTWLTDKGKVKLRSEGYSTPAARDKGIEALLANRDNKDRYSIVEKSGKQFVMLKSGNHQEIARSCALDDKNAIWALFPFLNPDFKAAGANLGAPLAAVGAAALAGAAALSSEKPKVETTPPPPVYAAATSEPEVAAAAGSGCMKYWWLLGLLLLALLLYWLIGKGCGKEAVIAPPPPPTTVETPAAPATTPTPAVTETTTPAKSCNLNWIYFDFNKANLRAKSIAELDELIKILNDNKDYTALLVAHTDAIGTDTYNDGLSGRRADAAKAYLVKKGIDAARITARMSGKKAPIAKNSVDNKDSQVGRQFNRRVELFVEDKDGKRVCESVPQDIPTELKMN